MSAAPVQSEPAALEPAPAAGMAEAAGGQVHRNPLRRLYHWVLHWAQTPYATWALALVAVGESGLFFPVPPDLLIIAMAFAAPLRALRYALVAVAGSIAGAAVGYLIGWALWQAVGGFVLAHLMAPAVFDEVAAKYNEYGVWVVFIAAFTPLPYIACTITAGVCGINFLLFILVSIIGRSLRYFMIAGLIRLFGRRVREFIERYFNLATIGITVLLIAGFVAVRCRHQLAALVRRLFGAGAP